MRDRFDELGLGYAVRARQGEVGTKLVRTVHRDECADGRQATVPPGEIVPARVLSTDAALNRRSPSRGWGVTLAFEGHVRDAIARGELASILEEFCAPFPGYYLYKPQRRHASRALRALIDHFCRWRQSAAVGQQNL